MKPAIEIRNLGKEYKLATSQRYVALRDIISGSVKNLFNTRKKPIEKFWALQNIDLDIQPGERVGIIGRNGAGKSTLLKIISRITPPTTGSAIIRGRVGSLLEVGTGFHPELTGRENIYLNGSILGLKKTEINKQLDAIIDFSGVEKFIDTPLKHFSSGMQLRLAFSVAAHLEPEILLIDEVLAVGDMEFQKKCIGKMEEVSNKDGRTIVFVSHQLSYITSLCNKAILLNGGKILEVGRPSNIINKYVTDIANSDLSKNKNLEGNEVVSLIAIRVINKKGELGESFSVAEKIGIEMHYHVKKGEHILWLGYNVHNKDGVNVFDTHSVNTSLYNKPHEPGEYKAIAWIPEHLLNTGLFFISCAIFNHAEQVVHFHKKDAMVFNVYDVFDESTARGLSPGDFPGIVRPLLDWQIEKV